MKGLILLFFIVLLGSCAVENANRYDSNSDRYKRMYGIHRQPAKTNSGPNSGNFHKR